MTKFPVIGIAGGAGSGKDTLGGMLAAAVDGVCVAQADPMKQLAKLVFGFDDDQLWGPSSSRNRHDLRFDFVNAWEEAYGKLCLSAVDWLATVFPKPNEEQRVALLQWFLWLALQHGFEGHHSLFTAHAGAPKRQLTPRYVLQTLGTEYGRQQDPRMWNRYALTQADLLLAGGYGYDRQRGAVADGSIDGTPWRGPRPYGAVLITDVRFPNECVGIKQRGGFLIGVENPEASNADVEKAGVAGHASEKGISLIPRHWYDAVVVNDKQHGLKALEDVVQTFVERLQRSVDLYATAYPHDVLHSC